MADDIPEGLDAINLKMNETTDQSLESTRRMLQMCEESKEAGIKTLVMLDDQGEQLERVEQGLDNINSDMKEAEEHLKGMEKCCGLCNLPCAKSGEEGGGDYNQTWGKEDEGGVQTDQPRITVGDPAAAGGAGGGYITKITNDAREDEMDENVQQVSAMVGNLRNMAIDMGTEVSNQNKQLDRVNQKADSNKERVKAANERATKLVASA